MSECFDEGRLRAYLDHALPAFEQAAVAYHLSDCPRCRRDLLALNAALRDTAALVAAPVSDPQMALARFRTAQPPLAFEQTPTGETIVENRTINRSRRSWFAALGAILAIVALFALPPVRAAADSLLQIFRVQQVVFVPVTEERAQQLKDLNFDGQSLFLSKPDFTRQEPQEVADAAAAASAAGFALAEPSELPSATTSSTYQVAAAQNGSFQINIESARQLLQLLDIKDVTLPDVLGEQPIAVSTKAIATAEYRGSNFSATLTQGASPEVTLPEGVDLSQLGNAMLQVLGTAPDQAKAMAAKIDWSSTLVVPMPSDISEVQQVTVNGAPAMLVSESNDSSERTAIYWQRGDQFYVLQANGLDNTELIVAAESVK